MFNFDLLKKLCETPGVSSREEAVRKLVIEEMRPLVDTLTVDGMGNVIGHRRGTGGPKIMLAAHMDEIGFYVRHIDDKGFIRLQTIGGFDARVLVAQRVHVHGMYGDTLLGALMPGQKAAHLLTEDEKKVAVKLEDLFVDLGLPADEVRAKVEIGCPVTLARTAEIVGGNVLSKSLDNRVSIFAMLETLRSVGATQCEIYAVASVQEEIGLRGVGPVAFTLEPDVAVAIDITLAGDILGIAETDQVTRLGGGAAIKIMDGSLICHPKLVRHFRDIAEEHQITHQLEILPKGGTDAGGIQRVRGGIPSFTLSIPTRYVHTVNEMASISDIECTILLLKEWLEDAHTRSYSYAEEGD